MHFADRLAAACQQVGNTACVGLDAHLDRLPPRFQSAISAGPEQAAEAVLAFNRDVIDVLKGRVAIVKPQLAFYEQLGAPGWRTLETTCSIARDAGLLVLADAKRGDIASTAKAYAHAILDDSGPLGADAVTLSPYMGLDSLEPWLALDGKGVFVLVRTTNPGSGDLQTLGAPTMADQLAQRLGALHDGGTYSRVGAVVGAQTPQAEVTAIRQNMPRSWFLVPGYGAQGADATQALHGAREDGLGALVSASRSVLFPPGDDHQAAIASAVDALCADLAL